MSRLIASATLLVGIVASGALAPSPAAASPSSSGFHGSYLPSISDAGDHAAVTTTNADGRRSAAHLRVDDGTMTDLIAVPDTRRVGDTSFATISGDGCVVVATTQVGLDVFRDDDAGERWDVYQIVLPHCGGNPNEWRLISTDDDGTALDRVDPNQRPAVSVDGTLVAFVTTTTIDQTDLSAVVVVDTTEPIGSENRRSPLPGYPAGRPDKPFHYLGADQPSISDDGNEIAFRSDFDPSTGEWLGGAEQGGPAASQVFVWRRSDESVRNVSSSGGWSTALHGVSDPVISGDGSKIAFVSDGAGFADLACEPQCAQQVFANEVDNGGIPTLLTVPVWGPKGTGGNGDSRRPAINRDGTVVAFVTDAINLSIADPGGGGTPEDGELIVATPDGLRPVVVPAPVADEPGLTPMVAAVHNNPSLSATGGVILFDSDAGVELPSANRDGLITDVVDPPESSTASQGDPSRQLGVGRIAPQLELPELDFGTVQADQESAEFYVAVTNRGPVGFVPSSVSSTEGNFVIHGGTCIAGVFVAVGDSCNVRLTSNPGTTGAEASLVVEGSDGASATTRLKSAAGSPTLRIDPAGSHLGSATVVGAQIDRAPNDDNLAILNLTNLSFDATTIEAVGFEGTGTEDFFVVDDPCSGTVLASAAQCTFSIGFRPSTAGGRSATVVVKDATGSYATALVGGDGTQTPTLSVAEGPYRPGDRIEVVAGGLVPGTQAWVSVTDDRYRAGPFTVGDEGGLVGWGEVPVGTTQSFGTIAVETTSGVLDAPIDIDIPTATPSFLPGYGTGNQN